MNRRVSSTSPVCLVVASLMAGSGRVPEGWAQTAIPTVRETLESLLARHGLDDLIVIDLESRFATAPTDDRVVIGRQLAAQYLRMLREAKDDADRTAWEDRIRSLLTSLPSDEGLELRLAVQKASYVQAERRAEGYRSGELPSTSAEDTGRRLLTLAKDFQSLAQDYRIQVRRIEMSGSRSSDEAAAAATRNAERMENAALECMYFSAWASYYGGWLLGDDAAISTATAQFAQILGSPSGSPSLTDLTDSMLIYDNVARSVLGIAMCKAASGDMTGALEWIETLERSSVSRSVAEQLPAFRIAAMFANPDWAAIEALVARLRDEGKFTTVLARLVAAESLRKIDRGGGAPAVRSALTAIADLAGHGKISDVVRLADQFNLSGLPDAGFPVAFVLGLREFERARQAHGSDGFTTDENAVRLYASAETALIAAASRRDAAGFSEAAGQARQLAAWTLYYRGRLPEAAKAFDLASVGVNLDAAESSAWMSVVSLEAAWKLEPGAERKSALLKSMRGYLARFPSAVRSGTISFRLAKLDENLSPDERVMLLDSIDKGSEAFQTAQRELERARYEVVRRAAEAAESAGASHEFIDAAVVGAAHAYADTALPLIRADFERAAAATLSAQEASQLVSICRRATAVLLLPGVNRFTDVQEVLDRVETADASGQIRVEPHQLEFAVRRVSLQAMQGEFSAALSGYRKIAELEGSGPMAQMAQDLIATRLRATWEEVGNRGDQSAPDSLMIGLAQQAYDFGKSVLEEDAGGKSETTSMLTLAGEAAVKLWSQRQDRGLLDEAQAWFSRAVARRASDWRATRGLALVAEASNDHTNAAEYWKQVTSLVPVGENAWFEARSRFIELLITDGQRERAIEVAHQHLLLFPDGGSAPYGDRIRRAAETLGLRIPTVGDGGEGDG